MPLDLVKAHAYGNDFLFVPIDQTAEAERAALARRICDRHTGVGGDGLVLYAPTEAGARMTLYNADGGRAEVSGNAVRCLAAIVARERPALRHLVVETDAGAIALTRGESAGRRTTFDALMGGPVGLRRRRLEAGGEQVEVVELSVGNPQCVVLGGEVSEARLHRLGPSLATHPAFPEGSNVEPWTSSRPPGFASSLGARGRSRLGPRPRSGHRRVRERGGRRGLRGRLPRRRGRVPRRRPARALDGRGHPSHRVGGHRDDRPLARPGVCAVNGCGPPAGLLGRVRAPRSSCQRNFQRDRRGRAAAPSGRRASRQRMPAAI